MKALRAAMLVVVAMLLSAAPAVARDFSGIYVQTSAAGVAYLNITDVGGNLTGYFQSVVANGRSRDGVSRKSANFTGSATGSHLVLILNASILSSGDRWTADSTWGGLSVASPQASGQIAEFTFRRSSIVEVNALIGRLAASAGQAKAADDAAVERANAAAARDRYYNGALAELVDTQQRLANNLNARPRALAAIVKAKAEVAKAIQTRQKAEAEVDRRKAIAKEKHDEAVAAASAARTNDESIAANQIAIDANQKDIDTNQAVIDVNGAQINIDGANRDLAYAKTELRRLDDGITQLRAIIAKDQGILAHR